MNEELKTLITSELTSVAQNSILIALAKRATAAQLLREADELLRTATAMIDCDLNGRHEFQTKPGSGMFGGRFEEKCIHCGWVHTC